MTHMISETQSDVAASVVVLMDRMISYTANLPLEELLTTRLVERAHSTARYGNIGSAVMYLNRAYEESNDRKARKLIKIAREALLDWAFAMSEIIS